jgi:hypothetical protein
MAISVITGNSTGSSGTVLTTGNPQSGGVIQTISYTLTTEFQTTSTSATNTGLAATIVPKFSTSKILVRVMCFGFSSNSSSYNMYAYLSRGSTYLNGVSYNNSWTVMTGPDDSRTGTYSTELLDSPATTSSITYNVGVSIDSGGTAYFNSQYLGALPATYPTASTITLMEIAA